MIRVERVTRYPDWMRSSDIHLDGERVGELRRGQTIELDVEPGAHELEARIDWCRTDPIRFEIGDETIDFECGSGIRGWRIPLVLLYISVFRNRYIWPRRA